MSRPIRFTVTNELTQNTGQVILVYQMPLTNRLSESITLSAWQILNPSANGGSQPFFYNGRLQLAVENENTLSRSVITEVAPNQLYTVTNNYNQGPVLHLTSESPPSARQVGVRNSTDPPISLNTIWFVDDRPVIQEAGVNLGAAVTFELNPAFFFVIAHPRNDGLQLQQFSHQVPFVPSPREIVDGASYTKSYDVPGGVQEVKVSWRRPGGINGADVLVFDPPTYRTPI